MYYAAYTEIMRNKTSFHHAERGQVILILVLITVVGLTIGLALISRTITDIRISSQIEQSSRAFSAAEAGIESALKGDIYSGSRQGSLQLPNVTAEYSVVQEGGTNTSFALPLTEAGSSQVVWLIGHNPDGSLQETGPSYAATVPLDVCWGSIPNSSPAMEVSLFYKTGIEYRVYRQGYDPVTTRGNGFLPTDLGSNFCDSALSFKKTIVPSTDYGIDPGATLLFYGLIPVYETTEIAVKPDASTPLPLQGVRITSVGKTANDVVRKISVLQSYQILPSLLDFGLFSEN